MDREFRKNFKRSFSNNEKILKIDLQRMDIVKECHNEKNKLISKLVGNEKKILKFTESTMNTKSDSESDENRIICLIEKEKETIFRNKITNVKNFVAQIKKDKPKVIFPHIPKHKLDHMFSALKTEKKISFYEKKLNHCLSLMHTSARPPWNSPSVILKAIKDCILRRKWENLTKLLFMLIHLPTYDYKPIVRHMCQILEKYHPVIQHRGLQNQFKMIALASKGRKIGNTKLLETV